MVGRTISHYRVIGQLGAGGMGVVYRAEDVRLGRSVALKFVSEDLAHDQHAVQRLRSEARAASALNHPNICTIYDIGDDDGHPFIVMELMKGRTLRDCLEAGALKVHELVDIGIQTAEALQAAHSEGIIHRDIKPGNIYVTERGQVKILDFGLAKMTPLIVASGTTLNVPDRTVGGVTLGTVAYMSPEQATGEELDGRTDLFSLGVVLYECATSHHPFPGRTSAVVLSAILNSAPVSPVVLNPQLPLRLQEVINNCLEKDRELRYQSAADLRADLKRVRRDIDSGHSRAVEVPSARSGSSWAPGPAASAPALPARPGGRPWRVGVGVALVAVVAAGIYAIWRNEPAPVESRRVEPAPDPAVPSLLALAGASLEARDYRAALAYAGQVLAIDPANPVATKIRDQARDTVARFDTAIADARRRMAAGDMRGAAEALDAARSIDARSPAVAEIASRLAERRTQREPVAESAGRNRPAPAQRDAPAATTSPAPQPARPAAPQTVTPEAASPPPSPPAGATPEPVVIPKPASTPTPTPPAAEPRERPQPSPELPSPAADDAAIRRLAATYARAIEQKDVALFRSIKPNLSGEEERRLQDGFRAVTSQRVELTVLSIEKRDDRATVVVRRRDTIQAGGRRQTAESQQTLTLERASGGWRIVDIR